MERTTFRSAGSSGELPLAAANEFIWLARQDGVLLTQMRLQKLIFFAHGWNLGLFGRPLVCEPFHAWKWGPVIPSVFDVFKSYGTAGIDREGVMALAADLDGSPRAVLAAPRFSDLRFMQDNIRLAARIWAVYGPYSGNQLAELASRSGSPWAEARRACPDEKYGGPIADAAMAVWFARMADAAPDRKGQGAEQAEAPAPR